MTTTTTAPARSVTGAAGRQPTRDEVPVEETWRLEDLFATPEDWERAADALEADLPSVDRFRGRLHDSAATLLECLRERDALLQRLQRISVYAALRASVDGAAGASQAMASRAQATTSLAGAALAFILSEIEALPVEAGERFFAQVPALAVYRVLVEDAWARRPHRLSAETEETLAALGSVLNAPGSLRLRVLAADLKLPPAIDAAGREVALSIARYETLAKSPALDVRRTAHASLAEGMDRHKTTLATTLSTMMERNVTLARLRRFPSAVEMHLDSYRMPREAYEQLLHVVHDESAPHVRRLMRLRARLLGLEHLSFADINAPLDPDFQPGKTYAEAQTMIRDAMGVLGEECQEIVDRAFRERWVDRADNLGKRNGAFCNGVYGVHPYVFLTWGEGLRSVFMLAHELGHAINSTLRERAQPYPLSEPLPGRYPLFWIEAPSTACELLLGRHILSQTEDPRLRRFVILQFLGTFFHNMTTHLLEAHFEDHLYQLAQAGKPITTRTVLDVQGQVLERYYGDTVAIDDGARLYWMRQPHFYRGLYSITYSAGLACAYNAVDAIQTEGQPAVDRWLQALRAGAPVPSLEVMRLAGVDLTSPAPIQRAVAYYGQLVDELERSFA